MVQLNNKQKTIVLLIIILLLLNKINTKLSGGIFIEPLTNKERLEMSREYADKIEDQRRKARLELTKKMIIGLFIFMVFWIGMGYLLGPDNSNEGLDINYYNYNKLNSSVDSPSYIDGNNGVDSPSDIAFSPVSPVN